MELLEPEMRLESQNNEMKRHEAWRVYGALLVSAVFSVPQQSTEVWFVYRVVYDVTQTYDVMSVLLFSACSWEMHLYYT